MKQDFSRAFLIFGATALLCASPLHAAEKAKQDELPVEVNADSLEVLQNDEKAIFRGNVIAVQGDMRLKSDVMTVHYRKKDEATKEAEAKPAEAAATPSDATPMDATKANTITKLETEGNVVLSTPEESASGTSGLYDVQTKKIYLNGDVVLTREQNILKGEKLVYDLTTGHSTLDGAVSATDGKPARVRGLFIPNNTGSK